MFSLISPLVSCCNFFAKRDFVEIDDFRWPLKWLGKKTRICGLALCVRYLRIGWDLGGGSENLSRNSKPHFACWLTHWPNRELLNICALKPTVQGLNLRNIQNAINGAPQWVETTANGQKKSKRSKKVHKSPQKTPKSPKQYYNFQKNSRKFQKTSHIFWNFWRGLNPLHGIVRSGQFEIDDETVFIFTRTWAQCAPPGLAFDLVVVVLLLVLGDTLLLKLVQFHNEFTNFKSACK
jgi:hypothetical protein